MVWLFPSKKEIPPLAGFLFRYRKIPETLRLTGDVAYLVNAEDLLLIPRLGSVHNCNAMSNAVKKSIYLPKPLARGLEMRARAEGKTFYELVGGILRFARATWLKGELRRLQRICSRSAARQGVRNERDVEQIVALARQERIRQIRGKLKWKR